MRVLCVCIVWGASSCLGVYRLLYVDVCCFRREREERKKRCIGMYVYTHTLTAVFTRTCVLCKDDLLQMFFCLDRIRQIQPIIYVIMSTWLSCISFSNPLMYVYLPFSTLERVLIIGFIKETWLPGFAPLLP